MRLRFDQIAFLVLVSTTVFGIIVDCWLKEVKLKIEPSLYTFILLVFGGIFYISNYIAGRLTRKAVDQYGSQIESNPEVRHQFETGSFGRYYLWLIVTSVLFLSCIYYGLVGDTLITFLLLWGTIACLSLFDAVGDYHVIRHLSVRKRRRQKEDLDKPAKNHIVPQVKFLES